MPYPVEVDFWVRMEQENRQFDFVEVLKAWAVMRALLARQRPGKGFVRAIRARASCRAFSLFRIVPAGIVHSFGGASGSRYRVIASRAFSQPWHTSTA